MLLGGVNDPRFTGNTSFDTGFVGVGALGYGFGNGLRVELEGDYRYNGLSHYPGGVTFGSSEQKYGGFVNLLYDFDFGWPLRPYIGVGVGEQTVQWKNGYVTAPNTFIRLQHEDPDVAYQAILGASYDLPIPGLALTAEYRFMAQPTRHLVYGQYFAPGIDQPAEAHFNDDYNHSILLGLRYAFNAAPPAPPPAAVVTPPPAREAARTYLVFFDWDSAALTDRARQDHRRGGAGDHPRAGDPDRGERLHRHLRDRLLQPGPLRAPRPGGFERAGPPRRAARRDLHPGLRRDPPPGPHRRRRPRAAEPPGRDSSVRLLRTSVEYSGDLRASKRSGRRAREHRSAANRR